MRFCLLFWLIVVVPCSGFGQALAPAVLAWDKAPVLRKAAGYEERTLLEGETHGFSNVTVQAITLGANHPAQPDQQLDEEAILVVKEGRLTVTLGQEQRELGPGRIVLVMPGDFFKLENKTPQPLTYYQIRLTSNEVPDLDLYRLMGQSVWVDAPKPVSTSAERGDDVLFEGPTLMAKRMRLAVTVLGPGESSHPAHTHPETELLIVLDKVVTPRIDGVAQPARQGDVVFLASGVGHTVQNRGAVACRYLTLTFD
ncbi:cupin domain-containing protein [Fibrisoma montanum]|uniref:Cupin domain-containing protein n=1 Tax=Fibrisoma montanum TaxID=2305895 RepID=A0A418LVK4_9BACT|nr:cupin domain-containing protein [Fibrisoma montanum]RIV17307.1 cupin domain-containing protein [Fibrisoma montanum]